MGIVFNRITSAILAGIFLLSTIMTGTFGWHSLSQTALNERLDVSEPQDVQLIKLEKDADPEKPLAGAVFYLFDADGEQIGGPYITDAEGKLHVELPPGDYYFEEQLPPFGYTFDQEDGAAKTRSPFTVIPGQEVTVVRAYNVPKTGSLTLQKLVENADETPLTDEQKALAFTFTVTFSDSGTYTCRIDGEGEPISFASGGQLLLRHGQTAVFEGIPVGVLYTVTETPLPGYAVSATGHRGNISEEGNAAVFINTYTPDVTGSLIVTKEVKGEGADLNKEFTFTAVIDGETVIFPLKHGEEKVFSDLPIGTEYTITETDYADEGYIASIREYTDVIPGQDTVLLPFVNVYNPDLDETGDLTIGKEVIGEGADPNKEFTFEITFEGEGAPESPQIFKLKNGESKIFTDIPAGVVYTVRETDTGGYIPEQIVTTGTVTAETPNLVIFRNHVPEEPSSVKLSVTKALAGEYPAADVDKTFSFTLIIDGEEHQFVLKPGETKEFELPHGAQYEVIEADYLADGYIYSVTNGFGIAVKEPIEIVVTNTFIGNPEIEIGGAKKWVLGDSTDVTLPESITVLLKHGEIIVEEKTVTPDHDGNWKYTFTASKYDADGNEIAYTVEELPVDGFKTVYNGYDITNEYLTPVSCDLPVVIKYVEGENIPETVFAFAMWAQNGAPMPEGSADGVKTMYITGSGEVAFGIINFTNPGVYTYIIAEQNSGEAGWTYDTTRYTLTVTVVEEDGKLVVAERKLEKNGEAAEAVAFTNTYTEPPANTVTVQGQKIWQHGTNPAENHPESIVVYVYADGELIHQWQVSAQDNWSYSFELPKYAADGHEIVYTIDEEAVDGYTKQIDGYNLVNTYDEPPVPPPDDPTTPPVDPDDPTVVIKYVEGENIPETVFAFTMQAQNGAPMPEGSADGVKTMYITGSGEAEFGIINFTNPGVYTYIIAEQNSGEAGWTYDTTRYTLTVTVVEEDDKLVVAERKLEKNGEAAEAVAFTNTYTEPPANTVTVQGQKIWQHGTNPTGNHPESIVVYVYADGELIRQWQVSAQDNWSYSFELPKYAADGHEIVYTIDEEAVDGYTKQIDGYNLINTYIEPPVPPPDNPTTPPVDPDDPKPDSPQTGDNSNLSFWFTLMILSLIGLITTIWLGRRNYTYVGKHRKRSGTEVPPKS